MAANLSNLKQVSSDILAYASGSSKISALLQTFFASPNTTSYDNLKTGLIAAKAASTSPSVRILVSNADGRVLYDSSKSDTQNTYLNFTTSSISVTGVSVPVPVSGLINDNHSGRPEMLQATLSSAGYGTALRFSDSVAQQQLYWATRLGTSVEYPIGLFRVSLNV